MARWMFFTNHLHVLALLAERPDIRLRDLSREVGITERAAHRIITELADDGYVIRTRMGSRNRYEVNRNAALRHPLQTEMNTGQLVEVLRHGPPSPTAAVDARPDPAPGELYRSLFDAAPVAIVVTDFSGRLLAVNPAACRMLARSEDELVGRFLLEFCHPDDLPIDGEELDALGHGERLELVRERRYLRPDGTLKILKMRVTSLSDPQTGERWFVSHLAEFVETRRHQEALAEAEERFRITFDHAPIGMALLAPDGRWFKVNRALRELTGYPETALLMRSFQNITHPDDLDADLASMEDLLAGRRESYETEKRYIHATGRVIWARLSVALVRTGAGEPLYFVSQIEDITERKQRQEILRRQAAHLASITGAGEAAATGA